MAIVFLAGCGDDDDDGAVLPVRHSISGQVTLDNGSGLSNVTMTLTGASSDSAITDASGNYTFDNLANGSYTITPSKTGFTFSPTDNTRTVSGANIIDVDFTATTTTLSTFVTMFASLDNTQETTGSTSTGVGGGVLGMDNATGQVRGFVVSTGVDNATAAHVHTGARGIEGPITVPLVGGPDLWFVPDNAADLTPTQVTAFQAGNMYFNIHNDVYTGGAIRGQLDVLGIFGPWDY